MAGKYRLLYTMNEFMFGSKVRNLCDLVNGLDKDVFEIEIGSLATGDEAAMEVKSLGVPVYRLRLQPPRSFYTWKFKDFVRGPYIIWRKKFDLVHSLNYQCWFTEPLIARYFGRSKFVYTKSNQQWDNHPVQWKWRSQLSDRIISISRSTDELLKKHSFGDRLARIYLGIDTDLFRLDRSGRMGLRKQVSVADDDIVFGCAAQFIPLKNHIPLIEAFEQVAVTRPNVRLFMCGTSHGDNYYREVENRIASSPMSERIHMLGVLSNMPAFYSAIDCFVLPSVGEAFGYVYIEAMSCNRPTIACAVSGPLDIVVDGETGRFCDPERMVSDLIGAMQMYADNSEKLKEHGGAARRRAVDEFSSAAMVRNHQELYLEILKSR